MLNEKLIVESIVVSENVISDFKDKLKKGLITTAVLGSLLASPQVSAQDKAEMKTIYNQSQTETPNRQRGLSTKTFNFTANGGATAKTEDEAERLAIKNARNYAVMKNAKDFENYNYSVDDIKVTNKKVKKEINGDVSVMVTISMKINVDLNEKIKESNKLNNHDLTLLVEKIVKNLKEDTSYDTSILESAIYNKLKGVQDSYNNYWKEDSLSVESFVEIMKQFAYAVSEFDVENKKLNYYLDSISDSDYYRNDELMRTENVFNDILNKIDEFSNVLEDSYKVVKLLNQVQYNVNIF